MKAIEKLNRTMEKNTSLVCVGLDPDWSKMPLEYTDETSETSREEQVASFLKNIIDTTAPHVCAYKIQKAFFDSFPLGHTLLKDIVHYIHETIPNVPVFVDCKIGDIDNTMEAYAANILDEINADGVVLNPYMGADVFKAVQERPEKAGIVLVQTSNESAVQDIVAADGRKVWEHVLDMTITEWDTAGNLIPVLSSRKSHDENVRSRIPDTMPILYAGYGAQGGDASELKKFLNQNNGGVFVNSSRGILYPYDPSDPEWLSKVSEAVVKMKNDLNTARS